MTKILVLIGRYYPKASPNSICMKNVLDVLPKDKYEYKVICYDDGNELVQDNNLIRISRGCLQSLLYRFEDKKDKFGKTVFKMLSYVHKAKMLLFIPVWPWFDPIFTYRVYKAAEKWYAIEKYDYILSVHMPLSSIIVGDKLKKNHTKIKHIPIFFDSLSGGRPLSLFSDEWNRNKKLKWEQRLLKNADIIVAMESSRAHHKKYSSKLSYYDKFVFLDIPLLLSQRNSPSFNPYTEKFSGCKNVVFCGTATQPMRNMKYFSELAKTVEKIDNTIKFHIIGSCNCTYLFSSSNIVYYDPMPHDKLEPYIAYSDVLLNFGVKTPSAISGKIFEYMSYAKPIISTYSIAEEACIPYLKKYPVSLLIDENDVDYEKQAKKMVEFILSSVNEEIDIEEIRKIFKNNMPETFVSEVFGKENI